MGVKFKPYQVIAKEHATTALKALHELESMHGGGGLVVKGLTTKELSTFIDKLENAFDLGEI